MTREGWRGEGAAFGGEAIWSIPRVLSTEHGQFYDGKFGMKRKETVTATWWRAEVEEIIIKTRDKGPRALAPGSPASACVSSSPPKEDPKP